MNALAPPSVVVAANKPVPAPLSIHSLLPPTLVHDSVKKRGRNTLPSMLKLFKTYLLGNYIPQKSLTIAMHMIFFNY